MSHGSGCGSYTDRKGYRDFYLDVRRIVPSYEIQLFVCCEGGSGVFFANVWGLVISRATKIPWEFERSSLSFGVAIQAEKELRGAELTLSVQLAMPPFATNVTITLEIDRLIIDTRFILREAILYSSPDHVIHVFTL